MENEKGLGFRLLGSGFRVEGSGFQVWSLWVLAPAFKYGVYGF